jgi:hypothetical protein
MDGWMDGWTDGWMDGWMDEDDALMFLCGYSFSYVLLFMDSRVCRADFDPRLI